MTKLSIILLALFTTSAALAGYGIRNNHIPLPPPLFTSTTSVNLVWRSTMSLDRNVTEDDTGKYALIRLDKLRKMIVDDPDFAYYARKLQRPSGGSAEIPTDIIELGKSGSDDEFFRHQAS
jgi:hypothetical protein